MNILRRYKTQPRMVMFGVVPGEEGLRKCPRMFDRSEPLGELRSILHGLELRFRIRIVVADRRSRMAFRNSQIGRRRATGLDVMLDPYRHGSIADRVVSIVYSSSPRSVFGQGRQALCGPPSAHHIATEDIESLWCQVLLCNTLLHLS